MKKKAESVFVVDIFKDVFQNVMEETGIYINYVFGDVLDIVKNLQDKDGSETLKDTKYVLAALYMPFVERRGVTGLYADVNIRRITLATLTNEDDEPPARYDKTFRSVLYPVYESFLYYFAKSQFISSKDPNTIVHTKMDVMGTIKISGINDFVDSINLDNFQFLVNQIKYC